MAKPSSSTVKRAFRRTQELVHDLYKLQDAQALKNVAWQTGMQDYQKVTHNHFFHSVDVKGNPQNTSAHIAGHFHVLEVVEAATDDKPATYKCSAPMKYVRKRQGNSYVKTIVPYDVNDTHTHNVQYIQSEKFQPRKINPEAAKLEAMEAQKGAPVPGIIG
jgi:hypothetical protein